MKHSNSYIELMLISMILAPIITILVLAGIFPKLISGGIIIYLLALSILMAGATNFFLVIIPGFTELKRTTKYFFLIGNNVSLSLFAIIFLYHKSIRQFGTNLDFILDFAKLLMISANVLLITSLWKWVFRGRRAKIKPISKTVSDLIALRELSASLRGCLLLFSGTAGYHYAAAMLHFEPQPTVFWITLGIGLVLLIDYLLLKIRVVMGWYGTNAIEAMEIARFLHKIGKNDGGSGSKRDILRPRSASGVTSAATMTGDGPLAGVDSAGG
jgi:hypothetical protein